MTCAGNASVPTPNIDRIASAGVRFTRAFCPYPVCIPSRMSFLTGVHAHTHGVTSHESLDWRRRTIAHTFRDHGYLTALIGKMHFLDGNGHGFDIHLSFNDWLMYLGPKVQHYANEIASYPGYLDTVHDTGSGFPDVDGLWSGPSPWVGHVTPKKSLASDLGPEDQFDSFVARESSRFIRKYKDEPFFLISGFLKPHAPFYPPKGFAEEAYRPDRVELPPVGDAAQYPAVVRHLIDLYKGYGEARLRQIRAGYLGNLKFVDTCIGEVYRTLEELDLLDDTVVVYTSDHGEMGGDHGLIQKFVFFEPSLGVPLVVSHSGKLPRGRVCDARRSISASIPPSASWSASRSRRASRHGASRSRSASRIPAAHRLSSPSTDWPRPRAYMIRTGATSTTSTRAIARSCTTSRKIRVNSTTMQTPHP